MAKELKNYITAYYEDEHDLKHGIEHLMKKNIVIHDVLTPFPVHGLEKLLKYKKSNLPKVGFWGGAVGAACGLGFQSWVFTAAWPINFGGKPFFSLPSFIPVTFECTVLFAAFAMVFAFLFRSKLGLGATYKIYDERITDDRFLILLNIENKNENDVVTIKKYLEEAGALGITVKN